ncbi:TIGR02678 family protein [Enterococcus mundtii]|nr:TIGR02678 family protein [Enterococcus mundtii]
MNLLFSHFWILREHQPEEYALLKSVEKEICRLIKDRFGYAIRYTHEYIKLEKIPVVEKPWMGIQDFQQPMDYALFCCLLAFLEERRQAPYFLLSHICEDLLRLFPVKDMIDWQQFTCRKSLIRVLKKAATFHLIEERDGATEHFGQDETVEVLYYATNYGRMFMRPYPEDISSYKNIQELVPIDHKFLQQENAQRYLAYRQLFLEPSILRTDIDEQLLYYLRNQRKGIADFVANYTDLTYEIYKDFFQLTANNGTQSGVFPGTKMLDDLLLQLATFVRKRVVNKQLVPETTGIIRISFQEWAELIEVFYQEYHHGWSKEFREMKTTPVIGMELLTYGRQWALLYNDVDEVMILPQLARFSGVYNEDFSKEEVRNGE